MLQPRCLAAKSSALPAHFCETRLACSVFLISAPSLPRTRAQRHQIEESLQIVLGFAPDSLGSFPGELEARVPPQTPHVCTPLRLFPSSDAISSHSPPCETIPRFPPLLIPPDLLRGRPLRVRRAAGRWGGGGRRAEHLEAGAAGDVHPHAVAADASHHEQEQQRNQLRVQEESDGLRRRRRADARHAHAAGVGHGRRRQRQRLHQPLALLQPPPPARGGRRRR